MASMVVLVDSGFFAQCFALAPHSCECKNMLSVACSNSLIQLLQYPLVTECVFVPAFDLCVALMGLGEVCEVVSDAKYAYGAAGK